MRLPAKTIRKIVEDYSDGATAALVAKRYGIAKSTVLGLIRGAGAEVRRPRLDNDDITLIVALHREGLQQSEIAARVGCSPSAVWHALRRISAI
jgi:DNA-binding CsgD family transcriptional regulator